MKSFRSETWAKTTIFATTKSALPEVATIRFATWREELVEGGNPSTLRDQAMFLCGPTPERRDAPVKDVLKQVAVVAGDLDQP